MTDTARRQIRVGMLLLVIGFPAMLGNLVGPQAEPPVQEAGQAVYLVGLLLAVIGNILTLRGLGPGPWHAFLLAAIILDSLACLYPLIHLAVSYLRPLEALENASWIGASLPLHLAAIAVLLWALGEICFFRKIPYSRPRLIQFGIFCLGTAIVFFTTAEEGQVNVLFSLACLLGQMTLMFPILKIRDLLSSVSEPV